MNNAKPARLRMYLLRHGQTEINEDKNIVKGRMNNAGLSRKGIMQANALGRRLLNEGVNFDLFYASPSLRTQSTANIVSGVLSFNGSIIMCNDLQEINQGDWEGKERSGVYTPEVLSSMFEDQPNFRALNGESQLEVESRMARFAEQLIAKVRESDNNLSVAVFGHSMTTKCLIRNVMSSNPLMTYKIEISNCSITEIFYETGGRRRGWNITRINDYAHLMTNELEPIGPGGS